MSNIIEASVTVRGLRPLLWHHFGPDAIPVDGRQERSGVAGNDPQEWRKTVLVTEDKQLYLEPSYVFGCVRDGAKFVKRGRGSIQSSVSATLQVVDEIVLVNRFLPDEPKPDRDAPVYIDIRSARNPTTKARNVRYRIAAAPGWEISFRLMWDKTIVSRGELETAVRDAGQLVGIGDGRSIGFGRFGVESFELA